jgi:hypothetical protein
MPSNVSTPIYSVPKASWWQTNVIATTSAAAGTIILTSGANTIYVTDVIVTVNGAMQVDLCSATTSMQTLYLDAKGGYVGNFVLPVMCTSAQSFVVVCGSSGACAVYAKGYRTV